MAHIVRFAVFLIFVLSTFTACSTHVVVGNLQGVQSARIEAGANVQLRKVDGEALSNYWSRRWRGEAKSVDVAPGKHIVNANWLWTTYRSGSFTRPRDFEVIALPGHTYRLEAEVIEETVTIRVVDVTQH